MEKKLQRSRKKKFLAGIAGGLGEYLDIDPVIIRVVFVSNNYFSRFWINYLHYYVDRNSRRTI